MKNTPESTPIEKLIDERNKSQEKGHVISISGDDVTYKKSVGSIEHRSLREGRRVAGERIPEYEQRKASAHISSLFQAKGINVLATGIVGSFAYGTPTEESDLDVLVVFDPLEVPSRKAIMTAHKVQVELDENPNYIGLNIDIRIDRIDNLQI